MEAAIYSILSGTAGVTALVSTRIYPTKAPQSVTYPCVIYARDSLEVEEALSASTTIRYGMFEVMAVASSYSGAKALGDAIRTALNRYAGTAGGITVLDVNVINEGDEYDDDLNVFIKRIEIRATYRE